MLIFRKYRIWWRRSGKLSITDNEKVLQGIPKYDILPQFNKQKPGCPSMVNISSPEELLPFLDTVANRPYNHVLHAGWD